MDARNVVASALLPREDQTMSKGRDQKKDVKKKAAKTPKEKKAEKTAKKHSKAFAPT